VDKKIKVMMWWAEGGLKREKGGGGVSHGKGAPTGTGKERDLRRKGRPRIYDSAGIGVPTTT